MSHTEPLSRKQDGSGRNEHDAWVLKTLDYDVTEVLRQRSGLVDSGSSTIGEMSNPEKYLVKDDGHKYDPVSSVNRDSLADSWSSSSSSSFSSSTDDSVSGTEDQDGNGPPRERQPLPPGVDLSQARMGREIKGGAFGTVSWVDGAKGAPPLVIKVPKGNKRAELEHEAEVLRQDRPAPQHCHLPGDAGDPRPGRPGDGGHQGCRHAQGDEPPGAAEQGGPQDRQGKRHGPRALP